MSESLLSVTPAPAVEPRAGLLHRLARNPQVIVSGLALAVIVVLTLFAPWIVPFPEAAPNSANTFAPPSPEHWFGTDSLGRDVYSRLLLGGQANILGAALATAISVVIGATSGLIAGYRGGAVDTGASWLADLVIALPAIIVLLAVSAAFGSSMWISMTVFGLLIAPSNFRLVRATVMAVRNELYVDAARVSGVGPTSIVMRHILAVVRGPLIIQSAMVFGIAIAIQAGLEFLGLGDPLQSSWGLMLNQGFAKIYQNPALLLPPVIAIIVTTLSSVILGNGLRDVLGESSAPPPSVSRRPSTPLASPLPAEARAQEPAAVVAAVRSLCIEYPSGRGDWHSVVNDVSLELKRGEVLGLVGESGSGKTQTAFSLLGLLPENARLTGDVLFDPTLVEAPVDRRGFRKILGRQIGYVPQEPMSNLAPSFTIGTQLIEPLRRHQGLSRTQARIRALELLDRVGIAEPPRVMRSYPHEISGGMAQRVLIAGAVSCDPQVLIADEPTTALDVTVQAEVLDLLRDLQRERAMAMLLVTHNFGVVADLCDRVAVMRRGSIVEEAPVRQLFRCPQHEYTRALLDSTLEGSVPRTRDTQEVET